MAVQNNLEGQVFGGLTVIGLGTKRGTRYYWKCLCKCGETVEIRNDQLEGRTNCGCNKVQRPPQDLTGVVFERLTVLSKEAEKSRGGWRWLCRCKCGNTVVTLGSALKSKHTKSCGCLQREQASAQAEVMGKANTTHGMARSHEYVVWKGIIQRCENPASPAYDEYGAKEISVCARWHSFTNFFEDMGRSPSSVHQIDRYPDQKGNYEPGNCRWATPKQQQRNRKDNVLITYQGRTQCISAWAEEVGMSKERFWSRFKKGWPISKIMTIPVSKHNVKIGLKNTRSH